VCVCVCVCVCMCVCMCVCVCVCMCACMRVVQEEYLEDARTFAQIAPLHMCFPKWEMATCSVMLSGLAARCIRMYIQVLHMYVCKYITHVCTCVINVCIWFMYMFI